MKKNEIIKKINLFKDKEKLFFFVGAGVSTLSKFPSWSELVLSMANEIKYNSYTKDKDGKPQLSSEEYLQIPQMYFNHFGKDKYTEKVHSQLNVHKEPNIIHARIMQLNPRHLITTNYDDLLEQSANRAGINYSVINSDAKVSNTPTNRYILKVHGDFETDNFVLKEQDYLDYENDFKLIDNVMQVYIFGDL